MYEFQPLMFPDCDRKGGVCTQSSTIDEVNYSFRPKEIPYHVLEEEDRPIGQPGHPFSGYEQVTTKHRAYNLSGSAFVDVSFDRRSQVSNIPPHQQVHIRIGNRAGAYNVWPPINAPQELLDFLNPFGGRECTLSAKSDERSIVFIAGPNEDEHRWYPRISRPNFSIGFPVIRDVKTWEDFLKRR
ncbi:hypothetical protein ABVK25_010155 [Lepraria finkii]|uniref:Uncharacterized protein n=1 Tax=Lepraria finkii TaxID=1340010 RepID=A0ABR4AXY8_9LECA